MQQTAHFIKTRRIAITRASKPSRGASILKSEAKWDPTICRTRVCHVHFLWTVMPDIFTALNNAESWFPYPRLVFSVVNAWQSRFSPCSSFHSPSPRSTFTSPSVLWEERERRERLWRKRLPSLRKRRPAPTPERLLPRATLRVRSTTRPFAREKQRLANKPTSGERTI